MPWIPLVIAAGAAVAGAASASAGRAAALKENEKAVQAWLDVNIPDPSQQKLALKRLVQGGELSPEMEQSVQLESSSFDKISLDPRTKEAQLRALTQLSDLGDAGGLTDVDRANIEDQRIAIGSQDRGRRDAIADGMARKGLTGSGVELVQQLNNAQSSQDTEARMSRNTMAEARQRALDSVIAGGRLAGDVRGQEYGEQRDLAGARDSISQFNARMLAGTRQRNTAQTNDSRRYNLDRANSVSDRNTSLENDEMKWNQVGRYQQDFENRATVAAGKANAHGGNASAMGNAANANAQMIGNIGAAAGKVVTAYGSQRENEDEDEDAE